MAASVQQTMEAVNQALLDEGGAYGTYSCRTVSWDDVQRGEVGGSLSCWGGNITDTRLWEKTGRPLFTVRSDNWNEKLGKVSADEVCLMAGGVERSKPCSPVTLRDFLTRAGEHGAYAGLASSSDLRCAAMDSAVSIRFQTTFLPVSEEKRAALEFAPEMYNYQTRSDADPRNLLLLCTTQGTAIQQDGAGSKKLFHHAIEPGAKRGICRYWFEAERSSHLVGGAQKESAEERTDALKRGKATAAVIGTKAMGTRFNVLMTIQVPLAQKREFNTRGGLNTYMYKCDSDCLLMCKSFSGPSLSASGFLAESYEPMYLRCSARCSAPPRRGTANAARVSRGSLHDQWEGLEITDPKRSDSEHVTVTVVIYNTVSGGVPSTADVRAAVDDMEALYEACGWNGSLASSGAAFMKSELTVAEVCGIGAKLSQQPYSPAGQDVVNGDTFPTSTAVPPAIAAPATVAAPLPEPQGGAPPPKKKCSII
mmetsp:Transcript_37931/g.88778  ORF Transcript_37931/g.88778 Transcript_37931/m.88778 type:complete len:480 (-) Transcript_37931:227-1666(-)|eukprot:CAMPEP_0119355640 /NCGR_PEP_ID=MMETSP1334-20130426/4447_1 /TAXON_ID=127549 /ORGANISM="Calcidiscus leptoporus, Strain RCC1130" /LENGTH=479 /DNA_ID=CAMNT_0007369505 /DNA_START=52 /DNA_END=1491 /DNA_ORIENTATION=-